MLAVLEETVAYLLELCRETEGSNQYGCIILYFCHSRIYCGPASQPCLKHELDHLILFLIAGNRFQIICDGESVFSFHVFETVRRSLDDFGHEALDIIQVGLSPR